MSTVSALPELIRLALLIALVAVMAAPSIGRLLRDFRSGLTPPAK